MQRTFPLAALLLVGGCRTLGPGVAPEVARTVEVEVVAALEAIPHDLEHDGPLGWLRHFEPVSGFRMVSEGELKFAGFAEARAAMEGFGPTIMAMELAWSQLGVEALAEDLASFGACYDELLVDNSGAELRFSGYVTGLVRRTDSGWRIAHLHWSMEAP